ncbi:hypothetical protein ISF26_05200 [Gloeobacter morelensis MG652769]|uniref:Transposase n=1 Tax=Gloeobacter morelensis MG652769 TaxID=2781736 RepID=A0ABY3PT98_9CYAN|nr:hypothetical protein ISF26_05200 [Gloeobacter morelensis MG652769]
MDGEADHLRNPWAKPNPIKRKHFRPEIIPLTIHWYLRYSLSYRQVEKVMEKLKARGRLSEIRTPRQVKYLNNLIEHDHCFIKWLTKPGLCFIPNLLNLSPFLRPILGGKQTGFGIKSWQALRGCESMNMICKGQMQGIAKGDIVAQARFVEFLFGLVA